MANNNNNNNHTLAKAKKLLTDIKQANRNFQSKTNVLVKNINRNIDNAEKELESINKNLRKAEKNAVKKIDKLVLDFIDDSKETVD